MYKYKEFIEEFAICFEKTGWPRMDGRIIAWLMISEFPYQTFGELVNILQASKSSISTSTRQLIRAGWIERIRLPGTRCNYYRLHPEFCSSSITYFIKWMDDLQALTEKGLKLLEEAPPERSQRLSEANNIFMFMSHEMLKLLEKWTISFHKKHSNDCTHTILDQKIASLLISS